MVRYRNNGRELVRFDVRMDGSPAGKRVCWPRKKGSTSGIRTGPETLQAFQFSPLVTTGISSSPTFGSMYLIHVVSLADDDEATNLDDDGRFAVIHVAVMRISGRHRVRPSTPGNRTPEFRSVGVVHERSKKAGAHCVSCV